MPQLYIKSYRKLYKLIYRYDIHANHPLPESQDRYDGRRSLGTSGLYYHARRTQEKIAQTNYAPDTQYYSSLLSEVESHLRVKEGHHVGGERESKTTKRNCKSTVLVGLSQSAQNDFDEIEKKATTDKHYKTLHDAIQQRFDQLKQDRHLGNPIKKQLIPKKYEVKNLFRIELPSYWRMLYTLKSEQITIIAFILDIVDHNKYNKLFKYKKK